MTWTLLDDTFPACGSCACWLPGPTPQHDGECHRFPPVLDPESSLWAWPATIDEDWCGEYRTRPGDAS